MSTDLTGHIEKSEDPTLVIRPTKGWFRIPFRSLWEHRELFYFLMWRDIKVRYKQTALGAAWAVLQPFLMMVVFSIFLGRLAKVPSDGLPYPVFAYAALVPWTLFAQGLNGAANSLVESERLVTKVYFPRALVPLAAAASFLLDFFVAMVVLVVLMLYYGLVPSLNLFWMLPLTVMTFITSVAVGFWLAAINVRYRDVRYAVPFLIQLWLFASPVAYPSSVVPEAWRGIYAVNPMSGVVEGFRWALLDTATRPGLMIIVSSVATLVVLITGLAYFQKVDRTLADVI